MSTIHKLQWDPDQVSENLYLTDAFQPQKKKWKLFIFKEKSHPKHYLTDFYETYPMSTT